MSNTITPRKNYPVLKRDAVHTAEEVSGKNPPKFNLKDHPEANGHQLIVIKALEQAGNADMGPYIIADAFVVPPSVDVFSIMPEELAEYAVTFMTGSENVLRRVMDAASINALPLKGTLRNEGRAWFLD